MNFNTKKRAGCVALRQSCKDDLMYDTIDRSTGYDHSTNHAETSKSWTKSFTRQKAISSCFTVVMTAIIVAAAFTAVPVVVHASTMSVKQSEPTVLPEPRVTTVTIQKSTVNNNYETISGFIAGAALTLTKTIVKYPMDTATVRLQMPNTTYSIYQPGPLFQNSYVGIVSPLLSNIPAGAVFFAVKDTISSSLKSVATSTSTISTSTTLHDDISVPLFLSINHMLLPLFQQLCASRTFRTFIAVAVAQIPYWMVRNPSEVVKTKEQAGATVGDITTNVTETMTIPGLLNRFNMYYTGYWENVIYAYPADVLKFVCYEQLSSRHSFITFLEKFHPNPLLLSGMETALYGAIATALAQYITTPLDVVRNRVMANLTSVEAAVTFNATVESSRMTSHVSDTSPTFPIIVNTNMSSVSLADTSVPTQSSFLSMYARSIVQLGQNEGWDGLFAGSIPRLMKAFVSGAIQFATYEETKEALTTFLSHKN